ncbi:hypothetical protein L1987_53101 [Smallanthus sonchifolius]|uniref:Uncharacterized protein n=1 Tax=Smallanthus sonchifolius TaxID=185202 RepID=A0ACB9EVB6_9ASTR|nr:hypothetical protein L1987_53101 [Smallanthus sonchifolius]
MDLMNRVCRPMLDRSMIMFIDDILIYSKNEGDHAFQLLGHVINAEGVLVDPSKIESVMKWNPPNTPTEIHSFFGLAGYYRRFIQDFSKIVTPLTKLTKKETKFEWGVEQDNTFQKLKEKLTQAPVLSLPEGTEDLIEALKAKNIKKERMAGQEKYLEENEYGVKIRFSHMWIPHMGEFIIKILDEAHKSRYSIHPGTTKMYQDLRQDYWWPAKGYDTIWVIVDRPTKSTHFFLIRETYSFERLAEAFITEIVSRHGVPTSIVSDRDTRFTSCFWKKFHEEMGTKLLISTAYHPQTDEQSERMIQTLEDMLRACIIYFGGSWDSHLPLVEFLYNNSYHASIGMPPYEMLYGRRCRTPICWGEVGQKELGSKEIVQATGIKLEQIRARLKVAQDRQKSYADKRRRPIEFQVGD